MLLRPYGCTPSAGSYCIVHPTDVLCGGAGSTGWLFNSHQQLLPFALRAAEAISQGLDFEQAIQDPDMPDLQASPQVGRQQQDCGSITCILHMHLTLSACGLGWYSATDQQAGLLV
jgi:hypothetical protein